MKRTTTLLGSAAVALVAGSAFADDPELLVFDWSGFEEDAYWAKYGEIHGDNPTYAFFGEEEEAFQKLRSGFRADVAHPCSQSIDKWRKAGLIEPWDLSKIPNYQYVPDQFKTASIFTEGDDVYFIPADNGTTAIAYNMDELSTDELTSL